MRCTFYRPQNVNTREFSNIVGKLRHDLHLLENGQSDEWSVYAYVEALCSLAEPLEKNPKMYFLGLADPSEMPADARVDFFYMPTYLATAFMMKAILLYSDLVNKTIFIDTEIGTTPDIVRNTLSACMLGCTARNFEGGGVFRLSECLKIFSDAGVEEFFERYPDFCPEFNKLYHERKAFVDNGGEDAREKWYI